MNDVILSFSLSLSLSLSLLNHIYSGQREENIMYSEFVPVLSFGEGGGESSFYQEPLIRLTFHVKRKYSL